ncbi:DUF1553 domain-containing protein [bacterium]|nr:DUF1553 domain-containing protein [bacterium]
MNSFSKYMFLVLGSIYSINVIAAEEKPVAHWGFSSEDATLMELHGQVHRDQAGPRPPEFPDFSDDNTALRFVGDGYFSVDDPGAESDYDFTNGDSITLEAWVKLDQTYEGQLMYLVGKGRTGSPGFKRDNQNWALRITTVKGVTKLSFLFATEQKADSSHWHRWTSKDGFAKSSGWHHVAVSYKFGEPETIRGWIDGQPTKGVWDMGGATKTPPVVDDDAVWIGSSNGASAGNTFRGLLDEVVIHRALLDDKAVAAKFNRLGGPRVIGPQPEVMPDLKTIPAGKVLFTFGENLPSNARWLNEGEAWPVEHSRWLGNEFLLPRLPLRYDDWGIRKGWGAPVFVRMAADVKIPAGEHRLLLRARSLSRLWIDGKIVARTVKNPHGGGNTQPIVPIADPPVPGARIVRFPQQEVIETFELTPEQAQSGTVRVILELVVGGPQHRIESGEVSVSIQPAGEGDFYVIRPVGTEKLPLTDVAVEPVLEEIEHSLNEYDDQTRRLAAASQNEFWKKRHAFASEWTQENPLSDSHIAINSNNAIDEFIEKKIQRSLESAEEHDVEQTKNFHENVLPILKEQCFRCHGDKEQGGLRLNRREFALLAGDSEVPAVVPGDLEASELIQRIRAGDMPPTEEGLSKQQIKTLETWVADGAIWPSLPITEAEVALSHIVNDAAFLRRAYLDTIGVPPAESEVTEFLQNHDPEKRSAVVQKLLNDDRVADHWVSFWQDLLAENPTLLNASLNSSGPFRWFLYDALKDGKSLDRMVTELILMRGDAHYGGSAGFGLAGENDAPMAAKGHIIASAFLGIELQCARCHDSPYHSTTQADLFSLAAMLQRKPLAPPKTSRVPDAFFEEMTRESLIQVTLKSGEQVQPDWPFAKFTEVEDNEALDALLQKPKDSRERLAALITAPQNQRFPRVIVNHLWKRLIGTGIVEPVHDWEGKQASHPQLLDWLAQEFVLSGYDFRHVLSLMMNSQVYQCEAIGNNLIASADQRFFNAPDPRRLTAEQIVDSLFAATGERIEVEELTFVHDGVIPMNRRLTLGKPSRAWMFASLTNERDRPSLSLPKAQPVVDVLQAFGWTGSRQKPIVQRETDPNVLQPGILANGTLSMSLTRAAYQSSLANLAINATSPEQLLDSLFLRFLSRHPDQEESKDFVAALAGGFESRLVPDDQVTIPVKDSPLPQSTWTNHLVPEANEIQLKIQERVLKGPAPDPRLRSEWREVYEDIVWSLVNHREFVWIP